jgi:hypothetical protein
MADPKTEEMQVEVVQREVAEPAETRTHERRAERQAYLRDRLRERAESEEEAET